MPTQSEIARRWKVSRNYINKLVKRGLPLSDFESARLWREAHASSKSPTDEKALARMVAEEEEDDYDPGRITRKQAVEENSKPKDPFSDALSLETMNRAADEAWRMLDEAMLEGRDNKIAPRLSVHTKAVEARIKAAAAVREELERLRTLIPYAEAVDLFRKGMDIILSRLRSLPQNVAARCNPANPHHAIEVLEAEVAGILAAAQQVYASHGV
jgi:hypothetical protein